MNAFPLLLDLDQPLLLLLAFSTLLVAYTIFALLGFGSALLASPPLAAVMPVAQVIPLLALLDCFGSATRGWRARNDIDYGELRGLLPGMLLGQALGVMILSALPRPAMAVALGGFVIWYGIRSLLAAPGARPISHRRFAGPAHGLIGGILGGMFGSGGFLYAAYLESKLASRDAFRATQAVLIGLSTAWRVVLCLIAGLIDLRLLLTALVLLPTTLLGARLGGHIDLRLSRPQLLTVLNIFLIASGLALIFRNIV